MIGVTLSLGSMVVAAATSQLGLGANSASLGASLGQGAAETQLGLVYDSILPSGSCPVYRGYQEGTALTVALYDYGAKGFTPAGFVVNSTLYTGNFTEAAPGALQEYALALSGCAHPSGLTVMAYDSSGDVVEFAT